MVPVEHTEHVSIVVLYVRMNDSEITVLACGAAILFLFGLVHMGGLEFIRWAKPNQQKHRYVGLLFTFWGLAALHLAEIGLGAVALSLLLSYPEYGALSSGFGSSAADYLYFAGVSFATLGYTQLEAHGAIRLFVMMLSLSGFMLITWSATFIYTIWGESFRE
jgi:hypothetical protein|tara:strand:+ start:14432 stop:14920 length:489 start_codon:yes stop_codon:yes gene_type:complete